MPSAYLLYLDDTEVGPSLELLRRISNPTSQSVPHITVRYPIKRLSSEDLSFYDNTDVQDLVIIGAGSFGLHSEEVSERVAPAPVVYLRCTSETLESLVYKPDYPSSVFHVTIYEGRDIDFAKRLEAILREYRWGIPLHLKHGSIRKVSIGGGKQHSINEVSLSTSARMTLRRLTRDLDAEVLRNLTVEERLRLIRRLCQQINSRLIEGDKAEVRQLMHLAPEPGVALQQLNLWSEEAVDAKRSEHPGRASEISTPPELAFDLVTAALSLVPTGSPIDFGDPAVGSGIFFAMLRKLIGSRKIRSAIGVELDPGRAEQTGSSWAGRNLTVATGDFLTADLEPTRSLLIANPPYVRFQGLDVSQTSVWRRTLRASMGVTVDGRSDLYVYFVLKAHKWLADNAVAAWLLPGEFMQTNYGAALRRYLANTVELARLHVYSDTNSRFENARVSSVAVLYRKAESSCGDNVCLSRGATIVRPDEARWISSAELASYSKWTAVFGRKPSARASEGVALGELFTVKRGIATGANRQFVLEQEEVDEFRIPRKWRKPVVPKARYLPSNVLETDGDGCPRIPKVLWLIDADSEMSAIKSEAPEFAMLLKEIEPVVMERALVKSRKLFYRQEQQRRARYFCKYMANSGSTTRSRFFLNNSQAVVLNNYLCLYPRGRLGELLEGGLIDPLEVLDMLTQVEEEALRLHGRAYVSGLIKMEPGELGSVVIHDAPRAVLDAVTGTAVKA